MADLQDPSKHPDFYTWTWDVWVSGGNWRAEYGWEKPQRGPKDTRIIRNIRPLYTRPAGVMVPHECKRHADCIGRCMVCGEDVPAGVSAAPAPARPDQGETCAHNRDERECGLCQRHAQQLERQRRLVATLPQTREDAEALLAGHRDLWRVDLPDGAYTQLPGDPPGPAELRRVQNGIVYDVQPRSGRLIPASKPRMLSGCVTAAVGVKTCDGGDQA